MEDAHISITPFSDKKLGLFGVFDGHGGIHLIIQGLSVLHLCSAILLKNCNKTLHSKMKNTKKLLDKLS